MSDSSDAEQGTPARDIFFRQLYEMINNESYAGAIDWLPDGNGFVILSKEDFQGKILPSYFGKAKYSSFARRLKRWGFIRGSDPGTYLHDNFRRNMVFDLDLGVDVQHAIRPVNNHPVAPKNLPLKKRTKWMSPSPSPSPFEEQRLCPHGSPQSQNSDAEMMTDLMRTINRNKRNEKREEGGTYPPLEMGSRKRSPAQVPKTWAAARSPPGPYGDQPCVDHFCRGPSTSNALDSMINPTSKVRHTRNRYIQTQWSSMNEEEFNSLLRLHMYLSKGDEHYDSPMLCHSTLFRRVPSFELHPRVIPTFNRAA
ncbi:hypothetical protein ACHAWF_004522 [Thalassiosira exigua]